MFSSGGDDPREICSRMKQAFKFIHRAEAELMEPRYLKLLRNADIALQEVCNDIFKAHLIEKFQSVAGGEIMTQRQLTLALSSITDISYEEASQILTCVGESDTVGSKQVGGDVEERVLNINSFFSWLCTTPPTGCEQEEDVLCHLRRLSACAKKKIGSTEGVPDLIERVTSEKKMVPLKVDAPGMIFDMNFYDESNALVANMHDYFMLCRDTTDLVVTTSCFAAWKRGGRSNGTGKIIPAIQHDQEHTRVFFFDDNMNLNAGGSSGTRGICNLRNSLSGEYVDFTEGVNGFERSRLFENTIIHSSSIYRNTLVQANILDAVAHRDYFTSIITQYSEPGETIVVYTDVNATILMEDTLEGKGVSEVLLTTMFALADVYPATSLDIAWESQPPFTLQAHKSITLKQLVHDMSMKDASFYNRFWGRYNCKELLSYMISVAEVRWSPSGQLLTEEHFWSMYNSYESGLHKHPTVHGIALSWFECFKFLSSQGHKAVVNSFGVDTRKVVTNTVYDEEKVLQITINYGLWGDRDQKAFTEALVRRTE